MPAPSPDPRTDTAGLTRRGLLVGSVLAVSGCSLRLEKGSPVPGPTPTTPADVAPLRTVRAHLTAVIAAARASKDHPTQAKAAADLHARQLPHVDATLEGLGSAVRPTGSSSATSSPSSSSGATSTDWLALEARWVGDLMPTLASISADSRPMALCLSATGAAAAEGAGRILPWRGDATFPSKGATDAMTAADAAIDALEWTVARTDADKRGSMPDALTWLYAVRGLAQAGAPTPSSSSTPEPIRRYADPAAAKKVVVTALQDLLSACAKAAAGASSVTDAAGVQLAWSKAIRELARQGSPASADFPGLSASG